jgi:hypothetical protein
VVALFGEAPAVLAPLFPVPVGGLVEELLGCAPVLVLELALGLAVVSEVDALEFEGTALAPGVRVGSHGNPVDGFVVCGLGVAVCGDGVAVCGVGVAVCAGGVAVCGMGVAVCARGVAVCGVGEAVWPDGVAVCGLDVIPSALANTAVRQSTSAEQKKRPIRDIIGSLQTLVLNSMASFRCPAVDGYPLNLLDCGAAIR